MLLYACGQARVTAAGEYLMTLPQTLEALLAAGEAAGVDAVGGVDAEWLDRVRTRVCLTCRMMLFPCRTCSGNARCMQALWCPGIGHQGLQQMCEWLSVEPAACWP